MKNTCESVSGSESAPAALREDSDVARTSSPRLATSDASTTTSSSSPSGSARAASRRNRRGWVSSRVDEDGGASRVFEDGGERARGSAQRAGFGGAQRIRGGDGEQRGGEFGALLDQHADDVRAVRRILERREGRGFDVGRGNRAERRESLGGGDGARRELRVRQLDAKIGTGRGGGEPQEGATAPGSGCRARSARRESGDGGAADGAVDARVATTSARDGVVIGVGGGGGQSELGPERLEHRHLHALHRLEVERTEAEAFDRVLLHAAFALDLLRRAASPPLAAQHRRTNFSASALPTPSTASDTTAAHARSKAWSGGPIQHKHPGRCRSPSCEGRRNGPPPPPKLSPRLMRDAECHGAAGCVSSEDRRSASFAREAPTRRQNRDC